MTMESEAAPWVVKGAVIEILDVVVLDFWTGQLPAAQEMGVVLERVRASLERVHIRTRLIRGVVRHKHQRFLIEVHNREGLVVRRSYDRPVLSLDELADDDDKTIIDTRNNLLLPGEVDSFDE